MTLQQKRSAQKMQKVEIAKLNRATPSPKKSNKFRMAIWIVLAIVMSVLVVLATQVDDWSRDLSKNFAKIGPVDVDESVDSVRSRLVAWVASKPNWKVAPVDPDQSSDSELDRGKPDPDELHFLRQTKLLKFTDDIHVTIAAKGEGALLTATSQSRLGKGDLGQNPRNLAELRAHLLGES